MCQIGLHYYFKCRLMSKTKECVLFNDTMNVSIKWTSTTLKKWAQVNEFFFLHGTVDQSKFNMHQLELCLPTTKKNQMRKQLRSATCLYFICCFFVYGSFKLISNVILKTCIHKGLGRIQIRVVFKKIQLSIMLSV